MDWTIFGHSGFIGSYLKKELGTNKSNHVHLATADDLRKPSKINYGNVIWAIGLTADFRQRPLDTIDAHISLLIPFLRYASFKSFTYLSSTRVYQYSEHTKEDQQLKVNPLEASDLYNLSKLTGEALVLSQRKKITRVIRLSNIIGPGEIKRKNFLSEVCAEAKSGHINLRSSIMSEKDYLWIKDAIELIIAIAEYGNKKIYNVASGNNISNQSWIEAITEFTGSTYKVLPNTEPIKFMKIDISNIENEFWIPTIDPMTKISHLFKEK